MYIPQNMEPSEEGMTTIHLLKVIFMFLKPNSLLFFTGQGLMCKHALLGKLPSSGTACLSLIYTTRRTKGKDPLWL